MNEIQYKKIIKNAIPKRKIAINFLIDSKTDEYLWKNAAKYHLPVGTIAASLLYWCSINQIDLDSVINQIRGDTHENA